MALISVVINQLILLVCLSHIFQYSLSLQKSSCFYIYIWFNPLLEIDRIPSRARHQSLTTNNRTPVLVHIKRLGVEGAEIEIVTKVDRSKALWVFEDIHMYIHEQFKRMGVGIHHWPSKETPKKKYRCFYLNKRLRAYIQINWYEDSPFTWDKLGCPPRHQGMKVNYNVRSRGSLPSKFDWGITRIYSVVKVDWPSCFWCKRRSTWQPGTASSSGYWKFLVRTSRRRRTVWSLQSPAEG